MSTYGDLRGTMYEKRDNQRRTILGERQQTLKEEFRIFKMEYDEIRVNIFLLSKKLTA